MQISKSAQHGDNLGRNVCGTAVAALVRGPLLLEGGDEDTAIAIEAPSELRRHLMHDGHAYRSSSLGAGPEAQVPVQWPARLPSPQIKLMCCEAPLQGKYSNVHFSMPVG